MFGHWLIGLNQPVTCRFFAQPNMRYQVLVGLTEAHWNKPGQRVMDIEIAGKVVATVDSFQKAKGAPSGHLYPATTDAHGRLEVRVCPHPGAPDRNTVVCGVLLFPAGVALDAEATLLAFTGGGRDRVANPPGSHAAGTGPTVSVPRVPPAVASDNPPAIFCLKTVGPAPSQTTRLDSLREPNHPHNPKPALRRDNPRVWGLGGEFSTHEGCVGMSLLSRPRYAGETDR